MPSEAIQSDKVILFKSPRNPQLVLSGPAAIAHMSAPLWSNLNAGTPRQAETDRQIAGDTCGRRRRATDVKVRNELI